jgi:putative PIN family toxin of toxin-antitoxin system
MRLVLDTNVVVAGLLWHGTPRTLMELAFDDAVSLYSSQALVEELRHTLAYRKFTTRIARYQTSVDALVAQYAAVVSLVAPAAITPTVLRDPDDDAVLACALAAQADLIVSGDADLLDLKQFQGIRIVTAAQVVKSFTAT